MRTLAFWTRAGWAALVALAACGTETAPVPFEAIRLTLALAPDARTEPPQAKVVARHPIVEPWELAGVERAELVTETVRGDTRAGMMVEGRQAGRLIVPGPFPADFNRLAIEMRARSALFVSAKLVRNEGAVQKSLRSPAVLKQEDAQVVMLDFADPRPDDPPFDHIELEVRGATVPFTLFGVDRIHEPAAARLPHVSNGPRLFAIHDDARRAVGLSSGAPLVARGHVPEWGVLAYSFAWPLHVAEPGREAALRVTVEGADGTVTNVVPLAPASREKPWWTDWIDLSSLAGQDVVVRFELTSPGPGELHCVLAEPRIRPPRGGAPTVVLVTSDTHRYDHTGFALGGADVETPVLDRLANGGLVFDDCFTSTNITLPSHVALMTGVSPRDTGIVRNSQPVAEAAPTLAECFADAGWRTFAAVSTRHLGDPESGLGQGFERMSWPERIPRESAETLDRLETWLPEVEGEPLFLWLHVFDAHTPYKVEPELADRYWPTEDDPRGPQPADAPFPQPPGWSNIANVEFPRAMYRAEIAYLDEQLGRLFGQERMREATIALTADHGESLGQHGIWWDHAGLYPDSIHVPLILRWPGGPAGQRVTRPVRQIDVGRTLLDLAGLASVDFEGRSVLDDVPPDPRFAVSSTGQSASVTVGAQHLLFALKRHRLSKFSAPGGSAPIFDKHEVQLFDLSEDPTCEHDLAESDPRTTASLRALLTTWLGEQRSLGWRKQTQLDEEQLAGLAELGYVTTLDEEEGEVDALFDPSCNCRRCRPFRAQD